VRQQGLKFEKSENVTHPATRWLAAIAQDAVDLLCNADLTSLKQCDGPTCIRFFYDTTKNHKRRWCSVEKCGSRAKAAAYYQRLRKAR
jgi:predicted RNA-binding Zn ribbon-like protein